jgi:hypothetical protein
MAQLLARLRTSTCAIAPEANTILNVAAKTATAWNFALI